MPFATLGDVQLYYEDTGAGTPVVFAHEFGADLRSWEPQVRYFSRRYRCVTYNARGYPPSDVPTELAAYSQAIAADDLAGVVTHLGLAPAHVVGLSMGAYATLHLGLTHPDLARSLVIAACGWGSALDRREQAQADAEALARRFETEGAAATARAYAASPYRQPFRRKDPRGFDEFVRTMSQHSALGAALIQRGIQKVRPSVFELGPALRALTVPTLIVVGDEDDPCLEPGLFMKRAMPGARLTVFPDSGHQLNLEEPDLFNRTLEDFFTSVDAAPRTHHAGAGGA